jgi:hypothetical protein
MTEKSASNLELAMGLPLDVVANRLRRIEADLRLLNMKTGVFTNDGDNARLGALIEARIETIYEALDSIRTLVSDIEADVRPRSSELPGSNRKLRSDRDD